VFDSTNLYTDMFLSGKLIFIPDIEFDIDLYKNRCNYLSTNTVF